MPITQKALFATGLNPGAHVLWVTDGSPGGTYSLVASTSSQFADAEGGNDKSAADFAAFGNDVLFATSDETHGEELWITDGTVSGTSLLKDIMQARVMRNRVVSFRYRSSASCSRLTMAHTVKRCG